MKLVKIQDKHIINKKFLPNWKKKLYDGNGCHTYVLTDIKTKKGVKYQLLATSHYYDPDKVSKIRRKNAILMKFKDFNEPTTVTNVRYSKDIYGKAFSEKYSNMQVLSTISPYQERRIRKELLKQKTHTPKKSVR